MSYMDIKSILKEEGFEFNKRYGQNFITDTNLLDAIANKAGIYENDVIVEIGAGAGTFTRALAKKAKKVVSFEIDLSLKPVLKRTLSDLDNCEVLFEDFMKSGDIEEYIGGSAYKVAANLPYYITTPVMFRFIENMSRLPESLTLMVQKEVADRICSKAGTKDYGALTVSLDAYYEAKIIMNAPRQLFYPVPNVDSAVINLTRRVREGIVDKKLFSKTVAAAFAMRRKTLANNLMSSFSMPRGQAEKVLSDCGIALMARGETLSTEKFIELSRALGKK